uniref:Uncharacterized protein n=1 Tax=Arion vulgaris TaxID=1028688 RepID=A0A0B7C0M7_9EUPU
MVRTGANRLRCYVFNKLKIVTYDEHDCSIDKMNTKHPLQNFAEMEKIYVAIKSTFPGQSL